MCPNTTEYMKMYYEKNRDKLKAYATTKKYCECCDKLVSRCNWNKHLLTSTHLKSAELKELKIKSEIKASETDEFIKSQAIKILEEYKKMMSITNEEPPTNEIV